MLLICFDVNVVVICCCVVMLLCSVGYVVVLRMLL